MTEKSGIQCFVSGRVQGVWFRAATQQKAQELRLTGWTRNLPDGRVEVQAFGEPDALEQLHQWLHQGPELANVVDVTHEVVAWQTFDRFGIK